MGPGTIVELMPGENKVFREKETHADTVHGKVSGLSIVRDLYKKFEILSNRSSK